MKAVFLDYASLDQNDLNFKDLENILKPYDITVSRIGYGLPAGGDIEYVDELTLKSAIESRKKQ